MSAPQFLIQEIEDRYVRENFKKLDDYFKLNQLLSTGFLHIEITVPAAIENYQFRHGLSFIPTEVVTTYVSNGDVTWSFTKFDRTNLYLSTTAACLIRAFVGSFQGGINL